MLELNKVLKFLDYFSIITVGSNKVPNHLWKEQQTKKLSKEVFIKHYSNATSTNFGLVTGFEDLEVIDVDLKVFSTTKEKVDFWEELISLLKESIFDFEEKFVIYKTKSAGYHILYKSKRVEGNLKLSSLKGHKEAVIETRGVGGYVFAYPDNKVSKKSYFDIEYISDDDRENLMRVCKSFNYVEPVKEIIEPKIKKKFTQEGLSPWDDFNNQNSVWDVVSDEFTVIKDTPKRIFIKRHGATSAHSGYIYKDDNLMFLHSTGTIYPHETQLSPYASFTYKYHNGNFSESAKDLYEQGFGERLVNTQKPPNPPEDRVVLNKDDLVFPIDIFPKNIQNYILECNQTLDSSVDYLGCSLLWLISLCVGNSMTIEVKRGWKEIATVWIAVVGKAGIGKTPSIDNIIFPLKKINNREIKKYIKKHDEFAEYSSLSAKEKKEVPEVDKPRKTQFIANDITLEALVDLHQESDNAVGVFKDELAGWFKDMNKYKQGSDVEFWLSTWSGDSVNLNRITRAGSFVDKPLIPVLGGIQPSIFSTFYTDENKDNGFMDRMLMTFPDLEVELYNENEMSYEAIQWYSDNIISFFEKMRNSRIQRDAEGVIDPHVLSWDEESKEEWKRIFNKITELQNSPDENEYLKSMLPKQKTYIPRFAMLIHVFNCHMENQMDKIAKISKDSILKAERLSDYFINMAKKVKVDAQEVSQIKESSKAGKGLNNFEKYKEIIKGNPDANVSKISEILGVSRTTIYKYKKELETKNEK